jgi:CheY-like chemotaxis protein
MSARAVPNTILFAEDDPNDVFLLERVVRRNFPNHRLEVVPDGVEAMAYLGGQSQYADRARYPFPRLVLLDVSLPKVNGLEVLAWIREQPHWGGLIVLVLTGSDSQEHMRRAYSLHANSFLKKHPLLLLPEVSKSVLDYWLNLNQFPYS